MQANAWCSRAPNSARHCQSSLGHRALTGSLRSHRALRSTASPQTLMLRHTSRSAVLRSYITQQASSWQPLVAEGVAAAAATAGLASPWASQHRWASSAAGAPQTAETAQSLGSAAAAILPEGSSSSAAVQAHLPQVAQPQGGPRQTAAGSAELDSPMQYRKVGRLQGPWKGSRRPIFAVVQIGGSQCKVTPGDLVYIEKIHADVADELAFDRILLLGTQEESVLGRPYIPGASVRAVVEEQFLNGKVLIFKKRRRKNSRRLNGHRQVNVAAVAEREATEEQLGQQLDFDAVAAELDSKSPLEIMDHALKTFGDEIGIAFSGAEDVALVEYAHLTGRPFRVFSLDTGRLNAETYQIFDAVEKHYGIRIEYTFPDAQETMDLVRAKGMYSFYEDGHQECCRVRKVRPLRRQLKGLKAWITGQRKDQSPGTRAAVPVVQVDPVFEGLKSGPGSLVKYNPLSNISSAEVWNFLRVMGVPTNALHAQGYVSIGCEPCTRAVLPNQHEREGRWWWEDATGKECGLHSGNVVASAAEQAKEEAADLWPTGPVEAMSKDQLEQLVGGQRDKDTLVVLYAPWCQYSQAMEESYSELASRYEGSSTITIGKFQADVERDFASNKLGLQTFPTIVMLPRHSQSYVKYPSERRDADSLQMWINTMSTRQ